MSGLFWCLFCLAKTKKCTDLASSSTFFHSANLEKTLKENAVETLSRERFKPGGWIILDAIDFVVHLFSQEQRENYALEHLWKDAQEISLSEIEVQ